MDALDDWWNTLDQIAEMPARSMIGLRAKAEAMQKYLLCSVLTDTDRPKAQQLAEADADERLAWSLAADILALGRAAA